MATSEELHTAGQDTEHAKCPSCGGEMAFDPDSGALNCPYCGKNQEIISSQDINCHDFAYTGEELEQKEDPGVLLHCNNCGANIVVGPNTSADFCTFCGSPMMAKAENSKAMVPDGIVPFRISQKAASSLFKDWIRGRFFSPGKLKRQNQPGRLQGAYIPHFAYDCTTSSDYTAEAGEHYYVTESVTVERDGKQVQEMQEVQKTRWYSVSGTHDDAFDNVLVNASKHVNQKLIKMQFDLRDLRPFQKDYIYGFVAESNSISKDECWTTARGIIEDEIRNNISDSIEADEVRNVNFRTDYQDVRFKQVLLPLWISAYTFKGKTYHFMINGQTGDVKGQAPLSFLRILSSILLTLGVSALFYQWKPTAGVIAFIVSIITLMILANRKPKKSST
ncbi:MAG TPA: hypothetical protein VHR42_04875 [Clostridia bacterium]|nr:hypothetical protein [Clostridia bacterium]